MSRYDTFSYEIVPCCCVYVFTVPIHAFLALLSSRFIASVVFPCFSHYI